jgi:hypothetical protein
MGKIADSRQLSRATQSPFCIQRNEASLVHLQQMASLWPHIPRLEQAVLNKIC